MDIDIDRLELFVAIVDEGSITAAARRVHVTQPAASRSLKLLEEALGVELFRRVGRGLELTAAGRALVPRANELLRRVGQIEREVRNAARADLFNLKLGTTDSIATYLLPRIIAPIKGAFPTLELQWGTGRSHDLLQQVRDGDLDAVVVASSGAPVGSDVRRICAYDMNYYGRADVFPELSEVRHESELEGMPIIELAALPGQPTLIGEHTSSWAKVSSLATIKAMILGGFGVGTLLDYMLEPAERARLVSARIEHDPDCALYLVRSPQFSGETSERITDVVFDALSSAAAKGGRVRAE